MASGSVRPLLRGRLGLYLLAETISATGSWAMIIALWGAATYHFDVGGTGTALIGLTWTLPALLLAPVVGWYIDRVGPRRVLVVGDAAAGVTALVMTAAGSFEVLLALAAVHGVAWSFVSPAIMAIPPRVVDDEALPAMNALLRLTSSVAIVVGPAVGGVAVAVLEFRGAFAVNAASYAVGLAGAVALRVADRTSAEAPDAGGGMRWSDVWAGLRVVRGRPELVTVLRLNAAVYTVYGAGIVLEPLYMRDVLGRTPSMFATIQATFGATLVVAGVVVAHHAARFANLRSVAAAVVLSGAAAATYLGTPSLAMAFLGVASWGVVTAFHSAPAATVLQRATPLDAHGRVMALDRAIDAASKVGSVAIAAALVDAVGVRATALAVAAACSATGLHALVAARGAAPAAAPESAVAADERG
jgi:MFS transporter, DHA3 family, macrolide efflux protein